MPIEMTVRHMGERISLGLFPNKRAAEKARQDFRAEHRFAECPCGEEFEQPRGGGDSIFCPSHRRWATWMRYKYRLDNETVAALLILKEDGCAVCGVMSNLCFDHCHATGRARGWLCHYCNTALGLVQDDVERLSAMIRYLKEGE